MHGHSYRDTMNGKSANLSQTRQLVQPTSSGDLGDARPWRRPTDRRGEEGTPPHRIDRMVQTERVQVERLQTGSEVS